uniref:2',5'-phosphodiesterase 12-like n=1 Tax=Dermatophagoides pteronyssinus TaxID=6956 RepID=A0A6P6XW25_DERPT|nr:2',5'-phosphodiesterase 12-like [Dermatophagoides pteronyssinus]
MMMICNVLLDEKQSENLSIVFKYKHPNHDGERLFTFKRSITESLDCCCKRMKINLEKAFNAINKKKKKTNNSGDATNDNFAIKFYRNNIEVDDNIQNKDFWKDGSTMSINGIDYCIKFNYPHISEISLSNIILTGYFTYPYLEIINGNITDSKFLWFRSKDSLEWTLVGEEFLYEVKQEDLDYKLKIVCIPMLNTNEGISKEAISPKTISKGPENCPFEKSFIHTREKLTDSFRIVSYNLLANLYANSEYSKDVLYSYCKDCYLDFSYRKTLLIKELIGYNGDIYFLQELDSIFYRKGLNPILKFSGLDSYFIAKESNSEGLCIAYRYSRFECLQKQAHTYSDMLINNEQFEFLQLKISKNQQLFDRIKKLKNTFQIILLKSKIENKNKLLILCNLHLYSKDDADHIRLIQTFITIKYIENFLNELNANENYRHCQITTIVSGDFNSTPEFGVLKFIKNKTVDSTLEDFRSNESEVINEHFVWEHQLNFESACGFPKYTHYAEHFQGCLDYIFYDPNNLKVLNIVPMIEHQEVIKEIALPNQKIPSDHLPLICTVAWNK